MHHKLRHIYEEMCWNAPNIPENVHSWQNNLCPESSPSSAWLTGTESRLFDKEGTQVDTDKLYGAYVSNQGWSAFS